jgi:hypothetical protein
MGREAELKEGQVGLHSLSGVLMFFRKNKMANSETAQGCRVEVKEKYIHFKRKT